jgi:hypothetical protein
MPFKRAFCKIPLDAPSEGAFSPDFTLKKQLDGYFSNFQRLRGAKSVLNRSFQVYLTDGPGFSPGIPLVTTKLRGLAI